jgi:dolichol kinase
MAKKKIIKKVISPLKFRRTIFHILFGSVILYFAVKNYYTGVRWMFFWVLCFGMLLSLASLRFKIPFIHFMLKKFEKPQYLKKFPGKGALFFVAGCLLVLRIFPKSMAFAAIAILTFADPLASLSGIVFGKRSHRKPFNTLKKIEGTIVGIVTGFFVASFFVPYSEAAVASVLSMLAEALTLKLGGDDVDDNIIVPVSAATAIYIKVLLFPAF